MPKHKYSPEEITCICTAYDHPHRLGGGSCTGAGWMQSFREIDAFDCGTCAMNSNNSCDVIDGIEVLNAQRCECLAEEIRSGYLTEEFGHLPVNMEEYQTKKYESHYEEH